MKIHTYPGPRIIALAKLTNYLIKTNQTINKSQSEGVMGCVDPQCWHLWPASHQSAASYCQADAGGLAKST